MDLKYFKNQGNDIFEINIKGIVDFTLDGDDVANEIKFLNEIGAKIIIERINSVGGGLINGFSIISANLASKAEIHTFNDGMAGSIASVILATGTPGKRFGFDFSTAVIHDPSFDGVTLAEIEDEKAKAETQKLKDSLVQIYANNTKMSKSQASKMMTEDKLINAKEQIEIGLIDRIVISKMKPALTKNMSYAEIMNVCDDKDKFTNIITNKNKVKMSDLTKFYNLSDDANEASILGEARKDRSKVELFDNKVKTLEKLGGEKDTEITNLKEEVKKYKNEAEKHQDEAIDVAVESYIKSGVFTADNKESLVNNAKLIGLVAFNELAKSIVPKAVNVLDEIDNKAGSEKGEKKTKDQKLADFWQNLIENNKPEANRIKNEEPTKYEAYVEAWNKY